MNQQNIFKKTIILIAKSITILSISYIGLFLLVFIFLMSYLILGSLFLTTPSLEKAKDSVWTISHYKLPNSFQLKYSRSEFWGSSMCYVFSYPEGYYTISNSNYNYLNQKKIMMMKILNIVLKLKSLISKDVIDLFLSSIKIKFHYLKNIIITMNMVEERKFLLMTEII